MVDQLYRSSLPDQNKGTPLPESPPKMVARNILLFAVSFWGIAWMLVFVSFLTILQPLHALRNATGFLVPLIAPVMLLEYFFGKLFLTRRFSFWIVVSIATVSGFGLANFYLFKMVIRDSEAESNTALAIIVFFLIYRGILFFYRGVLQQFQLHEAKAAWADAQSRLKVLETEKTLAELNALRSQLNPHFLFNNLNNLYSLIETRHPYASRMVLIMSDILRYILETSRKELVTVEEEVRFLENYIALEKIRLEDNCKTEIVVNCSDTTLYLPPLLFLPLVENCFKHGISTNKNRNFISIKVVGNDQTLVFTAENNSDPGQVPAADRGIAVGLRYLTRRLQALPAGLCQYSANQTGSVYVAALTIKLSKA